MASSIFEGMNLPPSDVQQLQCRLAIGRVVQLMSTHTIFDLELAAQQCGRAMLEAEEPLFAHT